MIGVQQLFHPILLYFRESKIGYHKEMLLCTSQHCFLFLPSMPVAVYANFFFHNLLVNTIDPPSPVCKVIDMLGILTFFRSCLPCFSRIQCFKFLPISLDFSFCLSNSTHLHPYFSSRYLNLQTLGDDVNFNSA